MNNQQTESRATPLSLAQLDQVQGGMCTFASKVYSTGAKLGNGQVCQANGDWSAATKK